MGKKHISLWMKEDKLKMCDKEWRELGFKSRSEFIDKAVARYSEHLMCMPLYEKIIDKCIPEIEKIMDDSSDRIAWLLLDQAIELEKIFRMYISQFKVSPDRLKEFHEECVEHVKKYNCATMPTK